MAPTVIADESVSNVLRYLKVLHRHICHTPITYDPSPPSPPPPPYSHSPPDPPLTVPNPKIILKTYDQLDEWYETLIHVACLLNLAPLFLDPPDFFTGHTDKMTWDDERMNNQTEFAGCYDDDGGQTYSLTILKKPEYPVIWERFPGVFLHRLTVLEEESLIERVERDDERGIWGFLGQGNGSRYTIVWKEAPSRERERRLGWDRLEREEKMEWEGVVGRWEREMRGYERQVWALGLMRAWLGGAIDRGLLRKVMDPDEGVVFEVRKRGGRRRDDDVGDWGEAGGLRKLVMGCMRVLEVEEDERWKVEEEREEEEEEGGEEENEENEEERRREIREKKRKAVD
ncbi:Putative protein of unknown function [Podospora comata]|uniref:Uncharacterized protein n=1 Tax=Podospora comata TaxID=48703 RepID=A0ABY6RVE0_PODCO|nr:Putative protein of unknown function [Podospora comata]